MKAVLISIKPEWCELIADGRKTVEVRKTRPKLETPFKCYIYETQGLYKGSGGCLFNGRGKIIGEFVCDDINTTDVVYGNEEVGWYVNNMHAVKGSGLDEYDVLCYCPKEATIYGWHISDLVIYDRAKELSEFYRKCKKFACEGCEHLKYQRVNADEYDYECEYFHYHIPITRPPQSWCYVEELKGE